MAAPKERRRLLLAAVAAAMLIGVALADEAAEGSSAESTKQPRADPNDLERLLESLDPETRARVMEAQARMAGNMPEVPPHIKDPLRSAVPRAEAIAAARKMRESVDAVEGAWEEARPEERPKFTPPKGLERMMQGEPLRPSDLPSPSEFRSPSLSDMARGRARGAAPTPTSPSPPRFPEERAAGGADAADLAATREEAIAQHAALRERHDKLRREMRARFEGGEFDASSEDAVERARRAQAGEPGEAAGQGVNFADMRARHDDMMAEHDTTMRDFREQHESFMRDHDQRMADLRETLDRELPSSELSGNAEL